jgi:hypothetical protein
MGSMVSHGHLAIDACYIFSTESRDDILMEIVPCIVISYVLLTFDYIAIYIYHEHDDH